MALMGRRERLVTEAASRPQRIARAFAAELLAPVETVRQQVKSEMIDLDAIDQIARTFHVSPTLVRHQIENHHLAWVTSE
jgi:hypothetical protein